MDAHTGDAAAWDERWSDTTRMRPREANQWVVQEAGSLSPGRALDVAAGEGRNAAWLARNGWHVTAFERSEVAVAHGRTLVEDAAAQAGHALDVDWVVGDAVGYDLASLGAFDLVLVAYLHLPDYERRDVLRAAAQAVAPGGVLLVIGHDTTNLTEGHGGPQDESILFGAKEIESDLRDHIASGGFDVERSGRSAREVATDDGPAVAWDVVVRLRRRDMTKGEVTFGAAPA